MFFKKSKKIDELESRLNVGEQQYNEVLHAYNQLRELVGQTGGAELLNLQDSVYRLTKEKEATEQATFQAIQHRQQEEQHLASVQSELQRVYAELKDLGARLADYREFSNYGLTDFIHPAQSSFQLGAELEHVKSQIKAMISAKTAVSATANFQFNNSASKGRKFVADMSKMLLRAYNAEAENCILTVKAGDGESARKRLDKAKEQVEKLGKMIDLKLNLEYHQLRLRELKLALDFQNAKKAEKEAEREEKARLREEKQAQKELENQRQELVKQKSHYENVLQKLRDEGRLDEAKELEDKIAAVEEEIASVERREANIRAGYVYVISNIGAFGERMVKIGMTRRLDPMDRVRELGDASVPFAFDVHALFFSEDAVGVENKLHHFFAERRVNKVNLRREFFYATPAEVKEALKSIAGNLLEYTDEPEAEQYRASQQL